MTTFATPTTTRIERDGRPSPRWAVIAAHLAPLVTLPSGLWRLGLVFGLTMGVVMDTGEPFAANGWENLYVIGLSVVSESVALLTIGLVRPWGERAPDWMPFIGGRRVPARPVVAVAATGTLALAYIWTTALLGFTGSEFEGGFTSTAWEVLFIAAYAPLLLWAPLVGVATFAYWRRRCRD